MNAPSVRWGWREASKSTAERTVGDPGTPHPSQAPQQMAGDSRISSWKPPVAQGDGGFTLLGEPEPTAVPFLGTVTFLLDGRWEGGCGHKVPPDDRPAQFSSCRLRKPFTLPSVTCSEMENLPGEADHRGAGRVLWPETAARRRHGD